MDNAVPAQHLPSLITLCYGVYSSLVQLQRIVVVLLIPNPFVLLYLMTVDESFISPLLITVPMSVYIIIKGGPHCCLL